MISRNPRLHFDGEAFRRYRNLRGMSIQEIARHVGKSSTFISMLEHGDSLPSLRVLRALVKTLDLGMAELFHILKLVPPGVSFAEFHKFLAACRQEQLPPAKVLADFIRAYAET